MSVAFTTYAEFKTEFKALKTEVSANIGTSDKYSVFSQRLENLTERIVGLNPEERIQAQLKLLPLASSIGKMLVRMVATKSWEVVKSDLNRLGTELPKATYEQRRSSVAKAMSPSAVVS